MKVYRANILANHLSGDHPPFSSQQVNQQTGMHNRPGDFVIDDVAFPVTQFMPIGPVMNAVLPFPTMCGASRLPFRSGRSGSTALVLGSLSNSVANRLRP